MHVTIFSTGGKFRLFRIYVHVVTCSYSSRPFLCTLECVMREFSYLLVCRANFRKHLKYLSEIRAVVNVNVMALTATCRESDRLNIMTDLCMNEAAHVQCSADRPNIFLEVRVMPGNIEQWSPILDDDVKILQTLGIKSDRKVFFLSIYWDGLPPVRVLWRCTWKVCVLWSQWLSNAF